MSEKTPVFLETDPPHWWAWWEVFKVEHNWKAKMAGHTDALTLGMLELSIAPARIKVIVECRKPEARELCTEILRAIGTDYPEAAHLLKPEPARSHRRNEPPTRDAPLAEWFDWYHGCNADAGRQVVTLEDVAKGVDRGLSTIKRAHATWTREPR